MSTKIIADCCCAHEGERFLMQRLIEEASRIGADYVKFQLFNAQTLNKSWENYGQSLEHYKKCELSGEDISFIIEHCEHCNIKPLFTTFGVNPAKLLSYFTSKSVKIASPDCNNWELIRYCMNNFNKVFISLGMHSGNEINKLFKIINAYKDSKYIKLTFIPLYCRSLYPVKQYTADDFRAMEYLRHNFKEWGLSDHSEDSTNALHIMKEFKPDYIERHFTLEKTGKKDDIVSSTPEDLIRLTNYPFPELSDEEIKNRKYITRWINE